jgi:S1-C subfamily serine protease
MKVRKLLWGIGVVASGAIACASIQAGRIFLPALDNSNSASIRQQQAHLGAVPSSRLETPQQSSGNIDPLVNLAVVTIYGDREVGSGSIVSPEGLVLTSRHVLQNSHFVTVKTATGQTYTGQVIDLDLQHDLALLRLDATSVQFPTVTLASGLDLQPGQKVYAIGSPSGKAGTLSVGTFTQITRHGSLQLSPGLLRPGNSGGPLLNTKGEMIGVNKGLLEDNSGLATSIAPARALIARHTIQFQK